jgi:hypothetical protein
MDELTRSLLTLPQGVWVAILIACFVFSVVVAVLGFLMPLFVFKIRNQIILGNKKLDDIVMLLGGEEEGPFLERDRQPFKD